MRDSEDDPEFKLLLRRIAAVSLPDYPDYRRGILWGVFTGGPVFAAVLVSRMLCGRPGWGAIVVSTLIFFVLGGAFGAFRPQN